MTGCSISEYLKELQGQPVAILCARYQYRGIVAHVGDSHVVLSDASMVEVSGSNSRDTPNTEDPYAGSISLSLLAVEHVAQPKWAYAPIPGKS